jgi:hypothetical protein
VIDNDIASAKSCDSECTIVTQKIPAAFAAWTPLVLSSIMIQLSFGAIDKLAACSKIAGCGLTGKSSLLYV